MRPEGEATGRYAPVGHVRAGADLVPAGTDLARAGVAGTLEDGG